MFARVVSHCDAHARSSRADLSVCVCVCASARRDCHCVRATRTCAVALECDKARANFETELSAGRGLLAWTTCAYCIHRQARVDFAVDFGRAREVFLVWLL